MDASRKHSLPKGFTLPETLMTIALLAILLSLSALAGNESYQRALAVNDVERIAGVLRHARSLAQAKACRVPPCSEAQAQGVYIFRGGIHMFEGDEFKESSVFESITLSDALLIEPMEVIFLPRSGNALRGGSLRMTDALGRSRTITVSEIGVIAVEPF